MDEEKFDFEKAVEKDKLKGFNWGAFGFTWIWALFNGAFKKMGPITAILILLWIIGSMSKGSFIYPLCRFIFFCLAVFCGFSGNEWAYYGNKKWKDIDSFNEVQQKWAIAAVIAIICSFVLALIVSL